MKPAFADTSFFVAYLNPRDESHRAAVELMNATAVRMTTTYWMLGELGNYLADGPSRRLFQPFVESLVASRYCRIIPLKQTHVEAGIALYARRGDKSWSFVDCISFSVMRELRLADALTADRHFEQAGFRALLA